MPLLRRRSLLKRSGNIYGCGGECPTNCTSNCPSNCSSNCSSNCPSNCSSNCSSNCAFNCPKNTFCEIACSRTDTSCPPVMNSDICKTVTCLRDCNSDICTNCALADTCVAESCESSDLCNDFQCNCNINTCPPVSHINDAL